MVATGDREVGGAPRRTVPGEERDAERYAHALGSGRIPAAGRLPGGWFRLATSEFRRSCRRHRLGIPLFYQENSMKNKDSQQESIRTSLLMQDLTRVKWANRT